MDTNIPAHIKAEAEKEYPMRCSLDEQQCREECKNKGDVDMCPFSSRLEYEKKFHNYFEKHYPHLIPKQ